MHIGIYTASSFQLGDGHLSRCLALAEALQQQGENITFLCKVLPGNSNKLIPNQYSIISLPEQVQDPAQLQPYIQAITPFDWLILDPNSFNQQQQGLLYQFCKKILVIEDQVSQAHCCDILLNQNILPSQFDIYSEQFKKGYELLLGTQYCLLGSQFSQNIVKKNLNRTVNRVLISMGAADPSNQTLAILQALSPLLMNKQVDVIVGNSNQHKYDTRNYCQQFNYLNYHQQVNNISYFIEKADIAIGSCGISQWERCYTGLPSLVISNADNQIPICQALQQLDSIHYCGHHQKISRDEIIAAYQLIGNDFSYRQKLSENSQRLIDGQGCERVIKVMRQADSDL